MELSELVMSFEKLANENEIYAYVHRTCKSYVFIVFRKYRRKFVQCGMCLLAWELNGQTWVVIS